jgi:AMP nucleosidase
MIPDGVKTTKSDELVTKNFVDEHIKIGIDALHEILNDGRSVRHLKFS